MAVHEVLDAGGRAVEVADDALGAREGVLDPVRAGEILHRELDGVVGAEATVEARPALGHVRRVVGDLAVDGLVHGAAIAPLDALALERVDGKLVDGLARVPGRAEGRRRDEPLVQPPRRVDAVHADAHQRAAAVGPDVARHRRLDAVDHHVREPALHAHLASARKLEDTVVDRVMVGRAPRTAREFFDEVAKRLVALRQRDRARRLDEPAGTRHVALGLTLLGEGLRLDGGLCAIRHQRTHVHHVRVEVAHQLLVRALVLGLKVPLDRRRALPRVQLPTADAAARHRLLADVLAGLNTWQHLLPERIGATAGLRALLLLADRASAAALAAAAVAAIAVVGLVTFCLLLLCGLLRGHLPGKLL
eukprot:7387615-Prymnesium_polylepis.1